MPSKPDRMSLHLRFLRDAFIKRHVSCVYMCMYVCMYEFDFVTAINHESCRGSNLRARPIVVGYRIADGIPEEIDLGRRREARRPDCFLLANSFSNTISLSLFLSVPAFPLFLSLSLSLSLSSLSVFFSFFFRLIQKLSRENSARRDR